MNCFAPKFIGFGGAFTVLLLLLGSVSSAPVSRPVASPDNESCISCHVQVFNDGIGSSFLHMPFWEQRCVQCHLTGGPASELSTQQQALLVTGTVVSQENMWRKLLIFKQSDDLATDHRISVSALDQNKEYRFRIVVSKPTEPVDEREHRSLWLGLKPKEIYNIGPKGLEVHPGFSTTIGGVIGFINLVGEGTTVFVSWHTFEPFAGWVEVQEIEGISFAGEADSKETSEQLPTLMAGELESGQHPDLRDPEELAIDVCLDCHSTVSLGTSHPVRIYGGHETRIPEELPTVNGMLTCVTCHHPHGAPGKNLVREEIKTKLCVTCHYNFKNRSTSTMFD